MLYAAVGVLPRLRAADIEHALADCRRSPGVVQVVSYPGLVCDQTFVARPEIAVVARGYWLARQALDRLVTQCGGAATSLSSPRAAADAGVTRAACGTAQLVDGRLRLWMATRDHGKYPCAGGTPRGIAEEHVDLRVVGDAQADASVELAHRGHCAGARAAAGAGAGHPGAGDCAAGTGSVGGEPAAAWPWPARRWASPSRPEAGATGSPRLAADGRRGGAGGMPPMPRLPVEVRIPLTLPDLYPMVCRQCQRRSRSTVPR